MRFVSRLALWMLRLAFAIPLILMMGFVVFEAGGCTLGLTHRGTCAHIPRELGEFGFMAGVAGGIGAVFVSPVVIVIGVVLEVIVRRQARDREGAK